MILNNKRQRQNSALPKASRIKLKKLVCGIKHQILGRSQFRLGHQPATLTTLGPNLSDRTTHILLTKQPEYLNNICGAVFLILIFDSYTEFISQLYPLRHSTKVLNRRNVCKQ